MAKSGGPRRNRLSFWTRVLVATLEHLEEACSLADAAFDTFRATSLEDGAAFLEKIAENITATGDELVVRCVCESGLSKSRTRKVINDSNILQAAS